MYNCYQLIQDVRYDLNEADIGYVQGTDTTGVYKNEHLLAKINQAYRYLYSLLIPRIPGHFYAKTTVTGVNSVYTLPGDFGQLSEVRNGDGTKVIPIKVGNISPYSTGCELEYYRTGDSITVNSDVNDTLTFYYRTKCRDITFGQATAGGVDTITLATTASPTADFYNGMYIWDDTAGFRSEITDYASRVATITGTASVDDWYGLIPEIPEAFHHLIAPKAAHMVKASYPMSQGKVTQADISLWNDSFAAALRAYGGENDDVPMDVLFEGG